MNQQRTTVHLTAARSAWGDPGFERILKQEIEGLAVADLPLQQGLAAGSFALEDAFQAMIIRSDADSRRIRAKVGIFFSGLVAGCSCADDPTPVEAEPEYCVLQFDIDRASGEAAVTLLDH